MRQPCPRPPCRALLPRCLRARGIPAPSCPRRCSSPLRQALRGMHRSSGLPRPASEPRVVRRARARPCPSLQRLLRDPQDRPSAQPQCPQARCQVCGCRCQGSRQPAARVGRPRVPRGLPCPQPWSASCRMLRGLVCRSPTTGPVPQDQPMSADWLTGTAHPAVGRPSAVLRVRRPIRSIHCASHGRTGLRFGS